MNIVGQCRNCGATIHEGDTFCRTCAMPIEDSFVEQSNNVATNDFMSSSPTIQPVVSSENNLELSNVFQKESSNIGNEDNKKYVNQDGNDRTKATLFNFLQLFLLVIVLAIIVFFLYQFLF